MPFTISDKIKWDTCGMAEKRLFLPHFSLCNCVVKNWGMRQRESGLTELTKFCKLTVDCENF